MVINSSSFDENSNILTLTIQENTDSMIIFTDRPIKNYIIDEDKVLAKIQVNKSKPKKQNRFQRKMAEIMEQAEKQKAMQQKRKK